MTFHEFMKSVVEHIDSRVEGINIYCDMGGWIVIAHYNGCRISYSIDELESQSTIGYPGMLVSREINKQLFGRTEKSK